MSDVIISPNMNLPVPIVDLDPGPDWANNVNACLGILDQHNHSPGQGVQITPAGLNINIDLPMQGNNLTEVNTIRFLPLAMSLPGLSPNLGCLYVAGNELYYNDESGNVIEITKTGSVNAGAGSISGLPSGTASVSYSSISQTYVFQSATSTPANIDGGSFIFRDITPSSNGVTVSAPSALSSNYDLFWPAAEAASNNSLLTVNTAGNMSYTTIDNSTLQISGGVLEVAPGGITSTQLGPLNVQVSSSSGSFSTSTVFPAFVAVTNLSVMITTSGRPVQLKLEPAAYVQPATATPGYIQPTSAVYINFINSTNANTFQTIDEVGITPILNPIDMSVVGMPGTYNYQINVAVNSGSVLMSNLVLVAYEL